MNIPKLKIPRVVILGGGFAGLKLARQLNSNKVQIVLIDRNNYHNFQPLMYQVATAGLEPDSIAYPLRKILGKKKNTHIRIAEINRIDSSNNCIETSIGTIDYDYLVVATGANTNFFGQAEIEKYAMPMKTLTESLDLRSLILQNFEKALNSENIEEQNGLMNFVIVGGGPTGVELAGALAELKRHVLPTDYPDLDIRRMQIHLVEASPNVLDAMSDLATKKATQFLHKMGVNIWTDTRVESYDGHVALTSKENFKTETLIWAAGVKGALVDGLEISQLSKGRIVVDEFSKIKGHENVFAIGDVSLMTTDKYPNGLPMLGSIAQQQGKQLAKNVKRRLSGKAMIPFTYNDKGTMATIGRNKAVVDLPKFSFSGFFAWMAWMFVHLMLLVDFRSRIVVFVNWTWSYIRFDKGTRVIVRKYEKAEYEKKTGLKKAS